MKPTVLSLCDYSGVMVEPWVNAGFPAIIVDIRHPAGQHEDGLLTKVGADLRTWLPPLADYGIVFAFPPCTHLARSGARWYKSKGLGALIEGLELVEASRRICEWSGAPWMLENPVGQLSTYWRKPDHYCDPCDFGGYEGGKDDTYTKKTCLWTGSGFVMPPSKPVVVVGHNRVHWAAPGDDRGDRRSVTPPGFAQAVYEANVKLVEKEAVA